MGGGKEENNVAHFSFRPLIGCKQAGNDKHLDNSCNTSACGFIGCRCTREVTDKLPVFSTQLALLKLFLATLVFLHSATHSIQLIMRPLYNSIFPNRVCSIFKIIVSVTITCLESYINTELIKTHSIKLSTDVLLTDLNGWVTLFL